MSPPLTPAAAATPGPLPRGGFACARSARACRWRGRSHRGMDGSPILSGRHGLRGGEEHGYRQWMRPLWWTMGLARQACPRLADRLPRGAPSRRLRFDALRYAHVSRNSGCGMAEHHPLREHGHPVGERRRDRQRLEERAGGRMNYGREPPAEGMAANAVPRRRFPSRLRPRSGDRGVRRVLASRAAGCPAGLRRGARLGPWRGSWRKGAVGRRPPTRTARLGPGCR